MAESPEKEDTWQPTLDLAELARVNRGDRVAVQRLPDSTQDLFERTLAMLPRDDEPEAERRPQRLVGADGEFIPQNRDLRALYLLAEALGGYETFHDIANVHSPGNELSRRYGEKAQTSALSPDEVRKLEEYQAEIHTALKNANAYLREMAVERFSREEMAELHEIILTASERAKELNRIMGTHYMHRIEHTVQRLYDVHQSMRNVDRSIDGIFLVDSEVLYVPSGELVECVNTLFKGVGNSYLSRNIDGVLLLAARNLLIEVASFYSYYGKHQIYNLFKRSGATVSTQLITARIRAEIRRLFEACARDNKLVLTRIMRDAEREFEISVDAITREAEEHAVEAVKLLIPKDDTPPPPPPKRGLFRRMLRWLTPG